MSLCYNHRLLWAERKKDEALTSLGDDSSGSNHDHGPVELSLEVADDLLVDLVEGVD